MNKSRSLPRWVTLFLGAALLAMAQPRPTHADVADWLARLFEGGISRAGWTCWVGCYGAGGGYTLGRRHFSTGVMPSNSAASGYCTSPTMPYSGVWGCTPG